MCVLHFYMQSFRCALVQQIRVGAAFGVFACVRLCYLIVIQRNGAAACSAD